MSLIQMIQVGSDQEISAKLQYNFLDRSRLTGIILSIIILILYGIKTLDNIWCSLSSFVAALLLLIIQLWPLMDMEYGWWYNSWLSYVIFI